MMLPFRFDRTLPGMTGGSKIVLDGLEDSLLDFRQCVIDARTAPGSSSTEGRS